MAVNEPNRWAGYLEGYLTAQTGSRDGLHSRLPNVEIIRTNNDAARSPHETCLRRAWDTAIGSA